MNPIHPYSSILSCFLSLCLLFIIFSTSAQTDGRIPFQGKIEQTDGKAVNGTLSMKFSLSYGTLSWSENHNLTIKDGLFFVVLGNSTPIPNEFFKIPNLKLSITVENETPVSVPLIPTPQSRYALGVAESILTPANFISAEPNKILATDKDGKVYWANNTRTASNTTFGGNIEVTGNTTLGKNDQSTTEVKGVLQLTDFQTITGGEETGMLRFNTQKNTAQIFQDGQWYDIAVNGIQFTTLGINNESSTLVHGALRLSNFTGIPQEGMIRYQNNHLQIYKQGTWEIIQNAAGNGLTKENISGNPALSLGGKLLRDTQLETEPSKRLAITGTGGFFVEGNSVLGFSTSTTTTQIGGGLILGNYRSTPAQNGLLRYTTANKAEIFITGNWYDIAVQGESLTTNNGLTKTGSNLQLGGALLSDTDIVMNSQAFTFSGNGTVKFTSGIHTTFSGRTQFEDLATFHSATFTTIPEITSGIKLETELGTDIILRYNKTIAHLPQFLSADGIWYNLATTNMLPVSTASIGAIQVNITTNSTNIQANSNTIIGISSEISSNSNNIQTNSSIITSLQGTVNTNFMVMSANQAIISTNSNHILSNSNYINANSVNIASNSNYINANSANITSNSNYINTNSANIASNSNYINANSANIASNSNYINANSANIASNSNYINTNSANIASNSNYINANSANIASNSNYINANSANIASNSNYINTNSANIASNSNYINANSANIASNSNYINANSANIASNSNYINANSANIASNSNYINTNSANIASNSNYINANSANIASNSNYINANSANIASNSNYINTNSANIASNSNYINTNSVNIASNSNYINTNSVNIASNSNYINTNSANIASNSNYINTNSVNIASNSNYINTNSVNIASNSNYINANSANIASNSNYINANSANIASNSNQIQINSQNIADLQDGYHFSGQVSAPMITANFITVDEVQINSVLHEIRSQFLTAEFITTNFMTINEIWLKNDIYANDDVYIKDDLEVGQHLNITGFVTAGSDVTILGDLYAPNDIYTTNLTITDHTILGNDELDRTTIYGGILFATVDGTGGQDGMLAIDENNNLLFHTAGNWEQIALAIAGGNGDFDNIEVSFLTVHENIHIAGTTNTEFITTDGIEIYGSNSMGFLTVHAHAFISGVNTSEFLTVLQNSLINGDLAVNGFVTAGDLQVAYDSWLGNSPDDITFITGSVLFSSVGGLPIAENGKLGLDVNGNLMFHSGSWIPLSHGITNTFTHGGNTFGTVAVLGTQDNYPLQFQINNTTAGFISEESTFLGLEAGLSTFATSNTFIGKEAGRTNINGSRNTFIGRFSGHSSINSRNTFVGDGTGYSNTGSRNTFIGQATGYFNVGNTNTFIGAQAGHSASGSNNIFIGYQAGKDATGDDKLYIEPSPSQNPLIYGDFANDFVSINGNLAIGSSAIPYTPFDGTLAFKTGNFYGYSGGKWNQFATVNPHHGTTAILQGGNTLGTPVTIGTIDLQNLNLIVNNIPILKFTTGFGTKPTILIGDIVTPSSTEGGVFNGTGHKLQSNNYGTIAGGEFHTIVTGITHSFIGGGSSNNITGNYGVIAGGYKNEVSQHGFIGGGQQNLISSNFAVIGGGLFNTITITGTQSFIGAGAYHRNAGIQSFIGGGLENDIASSSQPSVIVGGHKNSIVNTAHYAFIGGGAKNVIDDGDYNFIGAGQHNYIFGNSRTAVLVGGEFNTVATNHSAVVGGFSNRILATADTENFIGGGKNNKIRNGSQRDVVVGGENNIIDNTTHSFIGAGQTNKIEGGDNNVIVGGQDNTIKSSEWAVIAGGQENEIHANYSFIAGNKAKVDIGHNGSFVWSDNLGTGFLTTSAPQQFVARASGGFQLYNHPTNNLTNAVFITANGNLGVGVNPIAKLHVASNITGTPNDMSNYVAVLENTSTMSPTDRNILALHMKDNPSSDTHNYVTFFKNNIPIGAIEVSPPSSDTSTDFGDIKFKGGGADYAEWMYKLNQEEKFESAQIVAIQNGKITKNTQNATELKVISSSAIVLGNWKGKKEEDKMQEVAFLGQVPVKVYGKVQAGDLIIPSGKNDGTGIAISEHKISPQQYQQIVGTAWESSDEEGLKIINVAVGQNTPEIKISELMKKAQVQSEKIENLKLENQQLKIDIEQMKEKFEKQQTQINQLLRLLNPPQPSGSQSK